MKKNYFVLLWLYMLLAAFNASAASMMDGLTDPEDGMFDIAKGPEDTAIYFQFGHAWR